MQFWMPTVERLEMQKFDDSYWSPDWVPWEVNCPKLRALPLLLKVFSNRNGSMILWLLLFLFFFLIWGVKKPSLLLCWQSHGVSKKVVDIVLFPPVLHCIHAERLGIQDSVKNFCDKAVWEMHFNGLNLINLLLIKHKEDFCLQTFCISQQST